MLLSGSFFAGIGLPKGLYATLLENNGRHKEALQIVENSVAANKVTPEAIELLKKEYIKTKGSDKGFNDYFNVENPA